jgi:hypothetical protein
MITLDGLAESSTQHPDCIGFLEVWQKWRGDNVVPVRSDVHPEDLGPVLPAIAILEIESPERVVFRLHASRVTAITGYDIKGLNLIDLAAPEERQIRIERYQNLRRQPCGMFTVQDVKLPNGKSFEVTALFLPVASTPGEPPNLVYVAQQITEPVTWDVQPSRPSFPLAKQFSYVDIGCGLPD